ncbi:MAG: MoaD/ThiS family protein [Candidatus Dormibacteraeota bacterium]|uniref:Molybdopterin synthase sulfur carrier subunit n=2 Tax=Candidatus Aeolococcus gillhamiae TaxID=3127015 RepID=A0A934JZ46_9BACT|nr:MoaD/ThiS family protein [Candidatus Dormibacteraeota bacterium]
MTGSAPPLEIRVLLFGMLRERLHAARLCIHEPVATVSELWDVVTTGRPDVATTRGSVRCACNLEYCQWDAPLTNGDEVAFMPPVCGG